MVVSCTGGWHGGQRNPHGFDCHCLVRDCFGTISKEGRQPRFSDNPTYVGKERAASDDSYFANMYRNYVLIFRLLQCTNIKVSYAREEQRLEYC